MGKIVWLASYPKSGNTWLRVFLHNYLTDARESHDLNRLADLTLAESAAPLYQKFLDKPVSQATDEEISRLRPKVQARITGTVPENVLVKTHNALVMHLGRPLISMAHTQGAIYVLRNPLDVAVSYADHYGLSTTEAIRALASEDTTTETTARTVYEVHSSWSRHVSSWTGRPHATLHVLRYEDMLAQPLAAFAGVIRFLRLPEDRARLRRAVELSSFERLRRLEADQGFVERPPSQKRFFRSGKAGGWRNLLTPAEADSIQAFHGPQMRRFGY